MAVFITNTCNLLSHAHTPKAYGLLCNHSLSAKQFKNNNPSRRTKLHTLIRTRAVQYTSLSSSSTSTSSPAMTLYDVLSVPQSAELGELKKAYREKVRVYHPDICPPAEREESCKMFLLVQEAYETLTDPVLRADYDFNLQFSPHIMLLQRMNGSARDEAMQQWAEQLESLSRRSRSSGRDTWGGRMRRSREEAASFEKIQNCEEYV